MQSTAESISTAPTVTIERPDPDAPIFAVTGREAIAIRAGTVITVDGEAFRFDAETALTLPELVAGTDYLVSLDAAGAPIVLPYDDVSGHGVPVGGFHHAPGGNATAREGGDSTPAINPHSCWDNGFRPACPDPRGMALVTLNPRGQAITPFWADIYLLNVEHIKNGTSRAGVEIADGWSPPVECKGDGKFSGLGHETAKSILAHHDKTLLSDEEFRAATFGTTEAKSRRGEPEMTGLADPERDAPFTSRWGLFQSSGCMWVHGTDGDPDLPRFTILGGGWVSGAGAGSRASNWNNYPWYSSGILGARGRSDHLTLA